MFSVGGAPPEDGGILAAKVSYSLNGLQQSCGGLSLTDKQHVWFEGLQSLKNNKSLFTMRAPQY